MDISARWFDVAHAEEVRRFANTSTGITACLSWLATVGSPVRVGMEATGSYHLPLATALHAAGHVVLVCNPLSIARYSQAAPAQHQLRALLIARETLVQERLRLSNRQHAAGYPAQQAVISELQAPVLAAIEAQIARIDRERAKFAAAETPLGPQLRVVATIPGLGLTMAGALLASLRLARLQTARQVAADVGLCRNERSSGSAGRGHGHSGPLGPASLRTALDMPAIVAMRVHPVWRAVAERLRARGKRPVGGPCPCEHQHRMALSRARCHT